MTVTPEVPAVAIDGVSKSFRIPQERVSTLKERVLHPFKRARYERFDALHDVSFAVERGEFFGIVGPQRVRQEHAAQVPGGHLPRPTRARST